MAGKGSGKGSGGRRRKPRRMHFGGRVVLRHGLENRFWQDLYHLSMTASWPRFLGAWGAAFLLGNLVFSVLYHLVPGCIANLNPPFADWRPGDQRVFVCDVRKAAAELGWAPRVSVVSGTEKLYRWVEGHASLFAGIG